MDFIVSMLNRDKRPAHANGTTENPYRDEECAFSLVHFREYALMRYIKLLLYFFQVDHIPFPRG